VLTRASDVEPEAVSWLWTERLPLHDLAVLAGEPGLGKSTTTAELAARVSRGELDGGLRGEPHDVLIATAEDHFASVVLGRLMAAGADLDRVRHIHVADPGSDGLLALPDDVGDIEKALADLAAAGTPAALLIIDPVAAFISTGVDTHRDAAVRRVLAPLADMAQRQTVCVLAVAHLNKSTAARLLDRLSGSVAFGAAPRSVLAFARDPDDSNGEQGTHRVIVHAKSNHGCYAPTVAAHIEGVEVEHIGSVSRLVIDGESNISPEDLRLDGNRDRANGEAIREAIVDALADGEHRATEVKARIAAKLGVSERTVERMANQMESAGELERVSRDFPRVRYWMLALATGWRRDVATASVATENSPYSQPIAGVEAPSSDTSFDGSLLDSFQAPTPSPQDPEAAIGYKNQCHCANGGVASSQPGRCGQCYGHRLPPA
jgi:hypothetical protein